MSLLCPWIFEMGKWEGRTKAMSWPSGSDVHKGGCMPTISADVSDDGAAFPRVAGSSAEQQAGHPQRAGSTQSPVGELWRCCTDLGLLEQGHQPVPPDVMPFSLPLPCLSEVWTASHTNHCPSAWRMTESSVTCGGRAMCLSSSTTHIQRRSR